jgi:hypothetical protein
MARCGLVSAGVRATSYYTYISSSILHLKEKKEHYVGKEVYGTTVENL